jgi:hypothetical protein
MRRGATVYDLGRKGWLLEAERGQRATTYLGDIQATQNGVGSVFDVGVVVVGMFRTGLQ